MFEKEFELRYFEMNNFGEATPIAMLTLLQEAASDHCLSINRGLFSLLEDNIGWVLLSGYMEMERYPKFKEKITIRTWLSKYKSIRGYRENLIMDEQGKIIGRAKGQWLFYDIKNRKPVPIYDDIQRNWSFFPTESIKHDVIQKIPPIESADYFSNFNVKRFDLDSNNHVNNIRYLQWLLETIPDKVVDNCFLYSIDGRFIEEAQYGENIGSLTHPDAEAGSYLHTIKNIETGRVCATARTVWQNRK